MFAIGPYQPTDLRCKNRTVLGREKCLLFHQLERLGEHLRPSIDQGTDRIEVGSSLREPEKEWLAGVLRLWQGA